MSRLYLEIAHGGFGPGSGLTGFAGGWTTDKGAGIEDLYAEVLDAATENSRWIWPAELLPIADVAGSYACVDTSTAAGRIVEFDFEALDGSGRDAGWSRAFRDVAPSLDAWLADWLDGAPPLDMQAAALAAAASGIPEITREYWAAMTPAQRAGYGLPETGWGRALFGDAWGDDPRDGLA